MPFEPFALKKKCLLENSFSSLSLAITWKGQRKKKGKKRKDQTLSFQVQHWVPEGLKLDGGNLGTKCEGWKVELGATAHEEESLRWKFLPFHAENSLLS